MTMARLDQEIKRQEYILECLMTLKDIYNTGDCNICAKQKGCKYAPKPGEMVRYNCPFYEAENEKEVHFVNARQENLEPHTTECEEKEKMKSLDFCKNCNGLNENGEFKNRLRCLLSCGKYASEFVKKYYDESKVYKGCSTCKNCERVHKYPSYVTAEECVCTVGLECDTVLSKVKDCPKWVGKFESEVEK